MTEKEIVGREFSVICYLKTAAAKSSSKNCVLLNSRMWQVGQVLKNVKLSHFDNMHKLGTIAKASQYVIKSSLRHN